MVRTRRIHWGSRKSGWIVKAELSAFWLATLILILLVTWRIGVHAGAKLRQSKAEAIAPFAFVGPNGRGS